MKLFLYLLIIHSVAYADKVCIRFNPTKQKIQKKVITSGNCPKRFIEIVDTSVLVGPQGPAGSNGTNGTNGADGALRVWGDGSAGAAVIDTNIGFDGANPQFTSLLINSGSEFAVTSGTTIRATGSCTINGTLRVEFGSNSGFTRPTTTTTLSPSLSITNLGLGFGAAGYGEFGLNTNDILGGSSAPSLIEGEARSLTKLTQISYGAGGGNGCSSIAAGSGGGAVALYCKQGITIGTTGLLNASGGSATFGGGGSGGLIVLASLTSVNNLGQIHASGGNGGSSNQDCGAGGGGGGGIIHFLSPSNTQGSTFVSGGAAGSNATTVTSNPRMGGGAGGSFGGAGGSGGSVLADNTAYAAGSGLVGQVLITTADPTSLIM